VLTPTLQREDGWLLFTAEAPAAASRRCDPLRLLAWSGTLSGGCKFARSAAGAELSVHAELPAFAESPERVAAIEAGFAEAAARIGLAASAPAWPAEIPAEPPQPLATLCREAGWPFEERADGSIAVDLGVPGAYVQALVDALADRIRIDAELADVPEAKGPCRTALAELLLRANGAFRMVRAVLGTASRAVLEVALPPTAGAAELAEALAALAVAARGCALEARLVATDEALAQAFLERSGMSPLR
jgi:hypothetical protein